MSTRKRQKKGMPNGMSDAHRSKNLSIPSATQKMSPVQAVIPLYYNIMFRTSIKIITLDPMPTHIFHISCGRLDLFGQIITQGLICEYMWLRPFRLRRNIFSGEKNAFRKRKKTLIDFALTFFLCCLISSYFVETRSQLNKTAEK